MLLGPEGGRGVGRATPWGPPRVRAVLGGQWRRYSQAHRLELAISGVLEAPLTKFMLQEVKPGQTVVDVGANIGYFAVLLGHLVGPQGRVFAYEPNPYLVSWLRDNLSINYLSDRTVVLQQAAYSSRTTVTFYCARRFMGSSSIHRHGKWYFDHYEDNIEPVQVHAAPLDDLLSITKQIDLVKVDIEGGEYRALLGMQQLLRSNAVKTIVFELNRMMLQHDWEPLCALLHNLQAITGKSFFTLSPDGQPVVVDLCALLESGSCPHVLMR